MPGWDLFDEDPTASDTKGLSDEARNASLSWAPLDDADSESSTESVAFQGSHTWDSLIETHTVELPPAEDTASELKDGEIVWARVAGTDVVLGSGQPLFLPAGLPDDIGGWRRVRITDSAALHAEVLRIPIAAPIRHVGDEPELAYSPAPNWPAVQRQSAFPAGQGGGLSALFATKIAEARKAIEEDAAYAIARAEGRARDAETQKTNALAEASRRIEIAQRQADDRIHNEAAHVRSEAHQAVLNARAEAGARIRAAQSECAMARNHLRSALSQRNGVGVIAALGWLAFVLTIVVLAIGG
ncbi:hypothetical protein [Nocardia niigatensis]